MFIPVFGSCPTHLNERQEKVRRVLYGELGRAGLEWRSLGRTDYPHEFPLREILTLAEHCAGGLILGFSQFIADKGTWKKGTPYVKAQRVAIPFPTPWNQLEAGILFSLGAPLLVFREKNVVGGIFDNGVTDLFVQDMPAPNASKRDRAHLAEVFRKWSAKVHEKYYTHR